jgi:predicted nucleic acid-binding protein
MNDKNKLIFVDSDAFVALAKEDDNNHNKAVKLLELLLTQSVTFITSNYVFSETVTVISMRVGHKQAVAFIEKLKTQDNEFEIKWVDADIEATAIEIFKRQTSKNTSFVDCTNMALLEQLHAEAIFSFDEVYKQNGFQTVENL